MRPEGNPSRVRPALRKGGRRPFEKPILKASIQHFPGLWDGFPAQSGWSWDLLCEMQVAAVSGFIMLGLRPAKHNAGRSKPGEALSIQPKLGNGRWRGILELFILNPALFFLLQFSEKQDSEHGSLDEAHIAG